MPVAIAVSGAGASSSTASVKLKEPQKAKQLDGHRALQSRTANGPVGSASATTRRHHGGAGMMQAAVSIAVAAERNVGKDVSTRPICSTTAAASRVNARSPSPRRKEVPRVAEGGSMAIPQAARAAVEISLPKPAALVALQTHGLAGQAKVSDSTSGASQQLPLASRMAQTVHPKELRGTADEHLRQSDAPCRRTSAMPVRNAADEMAPRRPAKVLSSPLEEPPRCRAVPPEELQRWRAVPAEEIRRMPARDLIVPAVSAASSHQEPPRSSPSRPGVDLRIQSTQSPPQSRARAVRSPLQTRSPVTRCSEVAAVSRQPAVRTLSKERASHLQRDSIQPLVGGDLGGSSSSAATQAVPIRARQLIAQQPRSGSPLMRRSCEDTAARWEDFSQDAAGKCRSTSSFSSAQSRSAAGRRRSATSTSPSTSTQLSPRPAGCRVASRVAARSPGATGAQTLGSRVAAARGSSSNDANERRVRVSNMSCAQSFAASADRSPNRSSTSPVERSEVAPRRVLVRSRDGSPIQFVDSVVIHRAAHVAENITAIEHDECRSNTECNILGSVMELDEASANIDTDVVPNSPGASMTVTTSDDGTSSSSAICAFLDAFAAGCGSSSIAGTDEEARSETVGEEPGMIIDLPLPGPASHFTCDVSPAEDGTVSFEVAWMPPINAELAAVSHHLVEVVPDDMRHGSDIAFRVAAPHPQRAVRLAAVPRGRRYRLSLVPVGTSGSGPSSSAILTVAAEASAQTQGEQMINLVWCMQSVADSNFEGRVRGFRIFGRSQCVGSDWHVIVNDTQHSETFCTCWVPLGDCLEFRAAGITDDGCVQDIDTAVVAEVVVMPLSPNMVQDLQAVETAVAEGDAAIVQVSWRAPEISSGARDILHYRVSVCSGSPSASSRQLLFMTRVEAPSTAAYLSGFMRGSEYHIIVTPVSSHGVGTEAVLIFMLSSGAVAEDDAIDSGGGVLTESQLAFRRAMRQRWQEPSGGSLGLHLRRSSFFEESVAILGSASNAKEYLQGHLQVEFEGEEGVDDGGLLREWVTLVVQEGCREERGFFERLDEGAYLWPSTIGWHVDPEEADTVLRFLGRVVGVALLSGYCAGFMIHPIFWQWAFPREHSDGEVDYFLALRHFDHAQFLQRARLVYTRAQLAQVLGVNSDALAALLPDWRPLDEAEVEALELTWDYDMSVCGMQRSVRLPRKDSGGLAELGGSTLSSGCLLEGPASEDECGQAPIVAKADAAEYLRQWSRLRIVGSVEAQLAALREGILEVIPEADLSLLMPSELEELVVGVDWNVDELLPHVEVVVVREVAAASTSASAASGATLFQWLACVLRAFTCQQREAFLQYATGTPRLPAGGAAALRPKLTLQVIPGWTTDALPVAHTCANLLDVPLYPDLETLRDRLLTALRFGNEGFGII